MKSKDMEQLYRALVPQKPQNPSGGYPGQQPPMIVYPGPPAQPSPPYYMGNAPIQYPVEYPRQYPPMYPEPVDPWPMPPNPPRDPRPKKSGPSGLDLAVVIFVAAMFIIFIAAALPR